MLEKMWRKGNPSALLVGMQTGEATVENSMEFPQKTINGTEAGCSQEEGPKKGFVMGSRTRGVQEILEKCI